MNSTPPSLIEQANPEIDGKVRMILVAEALFAAGGINGVSMREIASKAGQGNHFAVQYHFGSREGLVEAIFDYRMEQMEPVRAAMLADAEAKGRLTDARTLLDMVYLPQLELPDGEGHGSYAGFLNQYLMRSRSHRFGDFGGAPHPVLGRIFELLRARLSYLPEDVAQRRLVTASFMFLAILVRYETFQVREEGEESFEDALHDTIDQIVGAVCAPLRLT
ncbi:MAG: TetR family transcriptional regulator [Sphingomonadales bacterium]|jgi:AcrR family transcriptional regulator|nr:TetR family transcriptional regulator [Sphingomonadales bacterium]